MSKIDLPNNEGGPRETEQLREWALKYNIRHAHLDELLKILRTRLLPDLPKSSKTFLQTCSLLPYEILQIHDANNEPAGEYVYIGIEKGLQRCVNPTLHPAKILYLQFNVDGLPLFCSSKVQVWPILCKVHHDVYMNVYKPFLVALYCGETKPCNVNLFLHDFVVELNALLTNGIVVLNIHLGIIVHCFICDMPARSFMKLTKGHGGYNACERCTVRGYRVARRTVYPNIECLERTDTSFRNIQQREHHNGTSILLEIEPPIDIVKSFVLDFMHLCCIGVMKRLLVQNWLTGNLRVRMSQRTKSELSRRLESLYDQIPVEFQRKVSSIQHAALWKATEFRFFLLYCGPIVLKNLLPQTKYKHFLLLHVACQILCTEGLAQRYNALANLYLRRFFQMFPRLYGVHSSVLNMHYLIHLADDVKNMGCSLSVISAFPFESFLGELKKFVRTPNQPLAQICRRLHERSFVSESRAVIGDRLIILQRDHRIINGFVNVHKMKYKEYIFTTKSPNDIFMLNDKKIIKVKKIFYSEESPDDVYIKGAVWKVKREIFKYPTQSIQMDMSELRENVSSTIMTYHIHSISKKIVKLSLPMCPGRCPKVFAVPFLHENN